MKESGVLSNIWSKYRLQKAEVSRIMVHLKTKDKFEIWNKSNNTDNKVVGLIISSRSELKRRKKKFSLTLQYNINVIFIDIDIRAVLEPALQP